MTSNPSHPAPLPTRPVTECLLCGSRTFTPDVLCYEYEGARLPSVRCGACGLVFLSRQPTREGFERLYDASYYESDYRCGCCEASYFESEAAQRAEATELLQRLEREVRPGRILEIGCAGGFFLLTARDRGWDPVGVEISDAAARVARERWGLDVRTGTVDDPGLELGSFDAVYMGDTLEHVPDPVSTLRRVHAVLRPGGVVLIAVPVTLNALDWRLRLPLHRALRRPRMLHLPPYHLVEFSPGSLAESLRRAGFSVGWVRQSKLPPRWWERGRRGLAPHLLKLMVEIPNAWITGCTGRLGDRALGLGRKPTDGEPAAHAAPARR